MARADELIVDAHQQCDGDCTEHREVPHGLPTSALTTTRARTARTMTQIRRMPTPAIVPAIGPISARTISPSERPSRRVDRTRTVMSWTAPANTAPARIHSVPGKYPIWAASTGPTSGPAPAIAAKWWPNSTYRLVGT